MKKRTPDFENNLLRILQGGKPDRATLFEFLIDFRILKQLGYPVDDRTMVTRLRSQGEALAALGYDYVPTYATWPLPAFRPKPVKSLSTRSINEMSYIHDWESFEKYQWPDIRSLDCSHLEKAGDCLPEGMKLLIFGPDGVLENAIGLIGYDNLCYLLYEEPELVKTVFDHVGSRLLEYYTLAVQYDAVGFICSNDDWGFNTQTMLSPADMRKYVFPWHKKIVEVAHTHGKPCMLHSCGYYNEVIEDVITDMKFDARHSYEDNIVPVEQAYEDLHGRISILGGIDIHFLCTRTPEEIYTRARNMLERSAGRGRYALGSGNSIPAYIPPENYLAMVHAALDFEG